MESVCDDGDDDGDDGDVYFFIDQVKATLYECGLFILSFCKLVERSV
jgi:hypothetical protein